MDDARRCKHDGDCVLAGCGNGCTAWSSEDSPGICVHYKKLTEAYCGCVAGFCSWFTQRRKVWRFSMGIPVARGWPKGAPRLTRAAYADAVDIFPQALTICFMERHGLSPVRFQVALTLDTAGKVTSTSVTGLPKRVSECVRNQVANAEFEIDGPASGGSPANIVVSSTWSYGPVWVD